MSASRSTTGLLSTTRQESELGSLLLAGRVVDETPNVPTPWRVMDSWVLSAIHDGTGRYVDQAGRDRALVPGSVMLIPPGLPHWYGTTGGGRWTETWAVFAGPVFDLLAHRARTAPGVYDVDPGSPLLAALTPLLSRPVDDTYGAERQLLDLFGLLLDLLDRPRDTLPDAIDAAARLLASDTSAELSLHDVARQVQLGYDQLRREFKRRTGVAPAAYRNGWRLRTAANLLRMTNLTQRAIARQLGYTDEFHFSRRFKQKYGVPPGTYRAQGRDLARTAAGAPADVAERERRSRTR